MNWQVLNEIHTPSGSYTLEADLSLLTQTNWCGILFMADSATNPSCGYLLSLTKEGYIVLLTLTGKEADNRILQKRRSALLLQGNKYHITIQWQKDICTTFVEDITYSENAAFSEDAFISEDIVFSEDTAALSQAAWPILELPLTPTNGCLAAIVSDNRQAAARGREPKDVLWRNFCVNPLNLPLHSQPVPLYHNPVLKDFADPDILYHEGTYYMYATSSSLPIGYEAYASNDLVHWEYGGKVLKEAWGMQRWYWAPDIMERQGRFYLLISVDEHLGIAVSDSPMGTFVPEPSFLFDKSIDGHYFQDEDGTVYIYYVSWREGKTYALYAMQMEPDCVTPILSTETLVIIASNEWEQQQAAVVEAPYMLKHKGKYYLTYSGSHFESIGYAVGYAVSNTPLGPFIKYEGNPILSHHYKAHGPGHHCIVKSPDGKEMFIVYHTHHDTSTVQPRNICIDRMRFVEDRDRDDRLEVYGPTVTGQPYPQK